MKKLIMIPIAIVLLISLQTYAQSTREKGTPEEISKRQGDELQTKLGLTDSEKAKFVEARTAQLTKLQGLERHNPDSRATMRASAADFENSLKTAFTPEHFDAWKKAKEEKKKNRHARKGRHGSSVGSSNG